MTEFDTDAVEGTDLDARDVRALTEPMTVVDDDPALNHDHEVAVYSGTERYVVRPVADACECPDCVHRGSYCKHLRRVDFARGDRDVPAWVDTDALDRTLAARLGTGDDEPAETTTPAAGADPTAVATDGGIIEAGDDAEILDDGDDDTDGDETPGYTHHREAPRHGGKRYVRCEGCGREILTELGGRDKLVHRDDCPNADRDR